MQRPSVDLLVKVAQIVQGFLTPVIAFGIGVITYRIQRQQAKTQQQQAKTNHLQHRLALMERRMKVFNATQEFIVLVLREAKIQNMDALFKLVQETREHPFLFDAEIGEYIDELYSKGKALHSIHLRSGLEQIIRPEDIEEDTAINMWFSGQTKVAEQKFLKYIDFREP